MINARLEPQDRALRNVEDKAARLAEAYAEESLRSRRSDPVRWRMPHLLWPLMTGKR